MLPHELWERVVEETDSWPERQSGESSGYCWKILLGLINEISQRNKQTKVQAQTCKVPTDGGLHKGFHPFSDDNLFVMTEVMCLVRVVDYPETIASGVNVLVGYHLVADDVDIALDLSFLAAGYN